MKPKSPSNHSSCTGASLPLSRGSARRVRGFVPRWRGCLKGGGGFLLILMVTTFMSLPSCHTKSSLTHTTQSTEQDSSYVSLLEQKLDSLTRYSSRIRTEKELTEKELETIQSGSTGNKDTVPDIPIQKKRLTAGEDYIDVVGQWLWMDYEWYRAPRTSTHTEVKDSSSVIESRYQKQLKQKDQFIQELENQVEILESREVKTVWPLREMIGGALIIAIICLLIGRYLWKR